MRYFAGCVVTLVLAVLVAGMFAIGSPEMQRKKRFDEQRIGDLMSVQSEIIAYWQSKHILPNDLTVLADAMLGFSVPKDPETGKSYSYKTGKETAFQICAVFNFASDQENQKLPMRPAVPYPMAATQQTWNHGAGIQCFDRTIDPDFFPPVKKAIQ